MTLSYRIGLLLHRSGMSQGELARRCGVTKTAVCQWVTGTKTPRLPMTQKIADAFEISLADLFHEVRLEVAA